MSIFLSPGFRRGGDILLDYVPNGGGDDQRHQFCAPIFDEKTLNPAFHGHRLEGIRLHFAVSLITLEK
jgi:hypothetical protein